MLENLSVSVEIRILKALKFQVESYDLTALGFSVMNLHHWVFQLWPSCIEVSIYFYTHWITLESRRRLVPTAWLQGVRTFLSEEVENSQAIYYLGANKLTCHNLYWTCVLCAALVSQKGDIKTFSKYTSFPILSFSLPPPSRVFSFFQTFTPFL